MGSASEHLLHSGEAGAPPSAWVLGQPRHVARAKNMLRATSLTTVGNEMHQSLRSPTPGLRQDNTALTGARNALRNLRS